MTRGPVERERDGGKGIPEERDAGMKRISLMEARRMYVGRRYTKELACEINRAGYSFAVSGRTGTIAEIRSDNVPKAALAKLLE